ncbi:MAG: hypothetical protein CNF02_09270 [OM182 bacterium MED-G28]|uniref:Uncharacterized protein n=1 Tax=OM182 bacterium MED-G28 TaxID=1986256 RepID=A0A2A5WAT2_9GAMM|nr:MAG: hypothetical protein CNF02_09270 [OM182 bacterium MED-G28]
MNGCSSIIIAWHSLLNGCSAIAWHKSFRHFSRYWQQGGGFYAFHAENEKTLFRYEARESFMPAPQLLRSMTSST